MEHSARGATMLETSEVIRMAATANRVVIAGAGVAGLETALALHALAGDAVHVELVAPETDFSYRPLAVATAFRAADVLQLPLEVLAGAAAATLRRGQLAAVLADEKTIRLDGGDTLPYDTLVLALGTTPREAVPGALTFRGPEDAAELAALIDRAMVGEIRRLVFVAPAGATWPLPVYELALLAHASLVDRYSEEVEVALVTPEDRPLALFGPRASDAVSELLEIRGISLHTASVAAAVEEDGVRLVGGGFVPADAVVALPRLEGPRIDGVPQDNSGFVPTDEFGWVLGLTDVYAAGDLTQFPVKQGGLATQQAEAVASAIAAELGFGRPRAFTPVLRGLLLTGMASRFLRSDTHGQSLIDSEPLWWPPAKIVGRYLSPLLAQHSGQLEPPPPGVGLPVEVELETAQHAGWTPV
jgi:sulfide:quinone oxidoreductase